MRLQISDFRKDFWFVLAGDKKSVKYKFNWSNSKIYIDNDSYKLHSTEIDVYIFPDKIILKRKFIGSEFSVEMNLSKYERLIPVDEVQPFSFA